MRKNTPKHVALVYNKRSVLYTLLHLQNLVLQGQYECFLVYDIALSVGRFAVVHNMLKVEIGNSIKTLDMGGFPNLWECQLYHFYRLRAMNWS